MAKNPGEIPQQQPIPEEIDVGFSSGIEDEDDFVEVWSDEDFKSVKKLFKEFLDHEPPTDKFAERVVVLDLIDSLWSHRPRQERDALIQDFLLIHRALKDGIKPQPKKMTAQDVFRLMGLARTMQKKINGEG
jgi:hypothetical protein